MNSVIKPNGSFLITKQMMEYYFLMIILKIIFDYSYAAIISVRYAYMGFENDFSVINYCFSWLVYIFVLCLVYRPYLNHSNKSSYELIYLLFLMSFLPFISMLGFGALEYNYAFLNLLFWGLLLYFTIYKKYSFENEKLLFSLDKHKLLGDKQLSILLLFFTIVVLFISGRYAHFRLSFDLLNVYEQRAAAKTYSLPHIFNYLFSWSKALNSILLTYFAIKKKYVWVLICMFTQLLSFGFDGAKTTFFLLLLALLCGFMPNFNISTINKWALRTLVIVSLIAVLIYILDENIVPISLFIRRVFYLPVEISTNYFDFFTNHQPDYFRQSFLRYFGFNSPYPPIPYLIGKTYYYSESMNANNGLISDAITNFGYIGIILLPIIISFVFKILDSSSIGLNSRIFFTVSVYFALMFTNSFLFTILLTHGFLITVFTLTMMPREKWSSYNEDLSCH